MLLLLCRRLSPKQSEASSQALHNVPPDDGFVTDMIKHWWQQRAPAAQAAQQPSALVMAKHLVSESDTALSHQGHPQQQQPYVDNTDPQAQSEQPLSPFIAGHPQAGAIDILTDKLQGAAALDPHPSQHADSTAKEGQGSQKLEGVEPQNTTFSVQNDVAEAAAAAADQCGGISAGSAQYPSSSTSQAEAADQSEPSSSAQEPCHSRHPSSPPRQAQGAVSLDSSPTNNHTPLQTSDAGQKYSWSICPAQAGSQASPSSSGQATLVRQTSAAEPSAGWQHYAQASTANEGGDIHDARNAVQAEGEESGLRGWVAEVQHHEQKLTQKVRQSLWNARVMHS